MLLYRLVMYKRYLWLYTVVKIYISDSLNITWNYTKSRKSKSEIKTEN